MITYFCKYTPLELLAVLGAELTEPNADVEDFRNADAVIHSSVCTHAKMLIEAAQQADDPRGPRELVLTNCCDSVRRVYDALEPEGGGNSGAGGFADGAGGAGGFIRMLDLPHDTEDAAVRLYAAELCRLRDDYAAYSGRPFDRALFLRKWQETADNWAAFTSRKEPFVAIFGARVSDQLRTMIRDRLPYPVIDLTCGGLRSIPQPPIEAYLDDPALDHMDHNHTGGAPDAAPCDACGDKPRRLTDDELMTAYAKALLTQLPCTRMRDASARAALLRMQGLVGIVYHSVKFCDYYSYEYADIRRGFPLPVLKIESDFTSQSEGQLDTRIVAFAENLAGNAHLSASAGSLAGNGNARSGASAGSPAGDGNARSGASASTPAGDGNARSGASAESPADSGTAATERKNMNDIFIGIDSGSTSTNVAALSRDGKLLAWSIVRTGARAATAAENALNDVKAQLGPGAERIRRIIATGYGREFIPFADGTKTEITCHARGAHFANPKARTVIDIGGQDSKVICLDADGSVANFVMNDKCAAGTGRFLEMMAHTLEMKMDEMAARGLKWKKDLTISSTCTVFAESEVVGLIAENADVGDIIHALDKSVALRTCGMVRRVRGGGPYMMTGGVAKNAGVAKEIEKRLGERLAIMDHPDLIGAIGAALFAAD